MPPSHPRRAHRFETIGFGSTALVTTTDDPTEVLKGYQVWEDGRLVLNRETQIYTTGEVDVQREALILRHLGEHPRIIQLIKVEELAAGVHSLRLERAKSNLRSYIESHDPPPVEIRLQMAIEVAQGVAFIHSKAIQHCDISCRNVLLFDDFHVKIADFGASILQGSNLAETRWEEPAYELPSRGREFEARPAVKRELFALGSAIFEITTWQRPWAGLGDVEIESRYDQEEYPAFAEDLARDVVTTCWKEGYETSHQVEMALRSLQTRQSMFPLVQPLRRWFACFTSALFRSLRLVLRRFLPF